MKLVNLSFKIFIGIILCTIVFSFNTENKSAVTASVSTESNLNHGIFLNDKLFKYKNGKKSLSKSKSKNSEEAKLAVKKQTPPALPPATKTTPPAKTSSNNQSTGNNSNTKVINGPILQKGWIKYFKFSGKGGNGVKHPDSFKENKQFYEQPKFFPNANLNEKQDGIFEFIRDPHFFFLHLFEQIITLNSSLHDKERRIIDQLSIYDINLIYEDSKENKRNGILEYGKFNEGYCLKISTKDSSNTIFIICTETEGDRTNLFNKIRALKIKDQHLNGIFKFEHAQGAGDKKETLSDLFGNKKPIKNDKNNSPKDGYWLTLQEWSQCSKKCDSGTSTFQRMCIPPKKGGKPCKGVALLVKPCNRQPCPKVTNSSENLRNRNNTEILKPIVKIMPFSNHPQRFTLCKIKESDMMIFEDGKDPIKQNEPLFRGKDIDSIGGIKIPSRVVMNTKTISIFAGEGFETLYLSFSIKKTKFYKLKSRKNCFKLVETAARFTTLCPYNAEVSSKEFEEWETDFFTFRDKCSRPNKDLEGKEEKELKDKINDRMQKAKQQAIDEANEERKTKKAESSNEDTSSLVKETNTIAMKAIQKESNLEELIKQEAEEKNKAEEVALRKQIEMEKKKQTCVVKAIREKELENQMQEKAKEIKETINTIKTEAATQVIMKRNNLKKLINEINKKAELKRNKLRQQLQQVRMSIASDIGNAYRKGDITKCTKAYNNPKARNDYCVATFSEDFSQLNFCRQTDDFCETCCQAEFGEMNATEKDDCLKKVCDKKPKE